METDKFAMSKDGLKYALPSKEDYIKCIMASNYFCTLSTPQYHIIMSCELALFRHSGIDQYCTVKLSPYTSLQAVYFGQGSWVISTKKPDVFTITCPDGAKSDKIINEPIGYL